MIVLMQDIIDHLANDNQKQCLIDVQYLMICRMSGVKVKELTREGRKTVVDKAINLFSKKDQARIMRCEWRFLKHINGLRFNQHYEW